MEDVWTSTGGRCADIISALVLIDTNIPIIMFVANYMDN